MLDSISWRGKYFNGVRVCYPAKKVGLKAFVKTGADRGLLMAREADDAGGGYKRAHVIAFIRNTSYTTKTQGMHHHSRLQGHSHKEGIRMHLHTCLLVKSTSSKVRS